MKESYNRDSVINTRIVSTPVGQRQRGRNFTRVISVTSGKGGTGKTTTVTNLAISLASRGNKVLVLDADFSLANIHVLLGVQPLHSLRDVIEQKVCLEEVIIQGPKGVSIIPATSGSEDLISLSAGQRLLLMDAIEDLTVQYDYLLIDTAAGIGTEVQHFNLAAHEIICVVTAEPTSLTDSYALIKLLSNRDRAKNIRILMNNVSGERVAKETYARLANAVERFLHRDMQYLGYIPSDMSVNHAICQQKALVELYPGSAAGRAFDGLAGILEDSAAQPRVQGGMQFFFRQLLEADCYGA